MNRTSCACAECAQCCKTQPGSLAPGDFERIAEHLGSEVEARQKLWASPGAKVMNTATGRIFWIRSITPRYVKGRCVFLTPDDRCSIHAVAPAGCALFDTHMGAAEGARRSAWLYHSIAADPSYARIRETLPFADYYKGKKV